MDRWLALGIFLLGAGLGALLTRIAQLGRLCSRQLETQTDPVSTPARTTARKVPYCCKPAKAAAENR